MVWLVGRRVFLWFFSKGKNFKRSDSLLFCVLIAKKKNDVETGAEIE